MAEPAPLFTLVLDGPIGHAPHRAVTLTIPGPGVHREPGRPGHYFVPMDYARALADAYDRFDADRGL